MDLGMDVYFDVFNFENDIRYNRLAYLKWVKTFDKCYNYHHLGRPLAFAGYMFANDTIKCVYCAHKLDVVDFEIGDDILRMQSNHHNCKYVRYQLNYKPKQFFGYDSLRYEDERLDTFLNWPNRYVSPFDLAEHGFFYLRRKDYCACIYCGVIVGNWNRGVDVMVDHYIHSPTCNFVTKLKPVGNIPMRQCSALRLLTQGNRNASPPPRFELDCLYSESESYIPLNLAKNSKRVGSIAKEMKKIIANQFYSGIYKRKVFRVRKLKEEEYRISTFSDHWPHCKFLPVKTMAEYGFFYTGVGDHVTCFYCGIHLRNWEEGDDPHLEHYRANSKCLFMKKFHSKIKITDSIPKRIPSYMVSIQLNKLYYVFEILLENNDIIDAIIKETVHSREYIEYCIFNRLLETGLPYFSVESFKDFSRISYSNNNLLDINTLIPSDHNNKINCYCNRCKFHKTFQPKSKHVSEIKQELLCAICFNAEINILYKDCKHVICEACSLRMKKTNWLCPFCRTPIGETISLTNRDIYSINMPCGHFVPKYSVSSCFICKTAIRRRNNFVKSDHYSNLFCHCCNQYRALVMYSCGHNKLCINCFDPEQSKFCKTNGCKGNDPNKTIIPIVC